MSKFNIQTVRRPCVKHPVIQKFYPQELTDPNVAREKTPADERHLPMPTSAQQITKVWTSFAKETMEYTKVRQQELFDQNDTDIAQLNEENSKAKI